MNTNGLCLCSYPTKVLLVDDSEEFIDTLKHALKKHFPLAPHQRPEEALDFLHADSHHATFIKHCIDTDKDELADHILQDFDLTKIRELADIENRKNEVSVIVVDYAMPDMNGLNFAKQVRQICPQIRIIMLTGEIDESVAVSAFNDGLIDQFLVKSSGYLSDNILKAIQKQQNLFFKALTEKCLNDIATLKKHLDFLFDANFSKSLQKIFEENNTAEYYLLDENGSFLLVSKKGEASYLAIANDEALQHYLELAKFDEAPQEIQTRLEQKTHFPYFHTDEDKQTPPSEWESYLLPAKRLEGTQNYYYSHTLSLPKK